jgi:hypothetical protein
MNQSTPAQPDLSTKEGIEARFQELCMVLGDLESKHQIVKARITTEIIVLNQKMEELLKPKEVSEPEAKPAKKAKASK